MRITCGHDIRLNPVLPLAQLCAAGTQYRRPMVMQCTMQVRVGQKVLCVSQPCSQSPFWAARMNNAEQVATSACNRLQFGACHAITQHQAHALHQTHNRKMSAFVHVLLRCSKLFSSLPTFSCSDSLFSYTCTSHSNSNDEAATTGTAK